MGFGMPIFMPMPFFGGILQFFFLITAVSLVFNVVRSVASRNDGGAGGKKKDDDGWGDL